MFLFSDIKQFGQFIWLKYEYISRQVGVWSGVEWSGVKSGGWMVEKNAWLRMNTVVWYAVRSGIGTKAHNIHTKTLIIIIMSI